MKKIRNFTISILSFIFIIAVGLLSITTLDTDKTTLAQSFTAVTYNETYQIGETVTIQKGEFTYKEKTYTANALVRFPNGNSYQYDKFTLEQSGKYSVEYSATADDGTLLKEIKTFTVLGDVYTVDGEGEYAYGTNAYFEDEVKGVNVRLGRNSTFTINTPIDVSNLTKNDSILKFYATPNRNGSADAGSIYVRLTDVHDKDKFVEVQYQAKGSFQYIYATANGQSLIGLRQSSKPTQDCVEYGGYYYQLAHNNTKNAGHVSRASLCGTMDTTNEQYLQRKHFPDGEYTQQQMFYYNALEIRMDYAKKQVYSQPDGVYAVDRCILADFDDERAIGEKQPWEGFTTGEVFISVYAKDYTASNFNFFITDIYGKDVGTTTMKNEIPPRLSVDLQNYDNNNLPNAIVGKKYNLFDAVGIDDTDGEVPVRINVYNSIGATLSVVDNAFIPTQAGFYTIEYTAIDSFENKTVKTLRVEAIERTAFDYQLSTAPTQCKAGETVSVKQLTLENPANMYDLQIYAKNAAQNVEYAIDESLQFLPLYAGTYEIAYVYTDYCTQEKIHSYDVEVSSSDLVVFEEDVVLPRYIIKGIQYPVAQMHGYTFKDGTQKQLASFYVQEGSGAARLIDGTTYSVESAAESVDLIYKIGEQEQRYTRAVIDAITYGDWEYKVDLAKYFYPSVGEFHSESNNKRITFVVDSAKEGKAELEVINPARIINDFNIGFHFETETANFEGVRVVLESAYDSNKTVEFKFEREVGSAAKVFISSANYRAEGSISSRFTTPNIVEDNFNVTYDATTSEFDVSGFRVDAKRLLENFDDLFYISFELYGIDGDSAIHITRVVNQKITKDEYDTVKPVVLFDRFKGYYVVGDQVEIKGIKVYDFVDPNPICKVELKNAAGYLESINGVKINGEDNDYQTDYVIEVKKMEGMNFKIFSEDFSLNSLSINLALSVKDVVAPTIQLDIKKNVYKVGDKVTVAECITSDDTTLQENLAVSCYLIGVDASVTYLKETSFKVEMVGKYTICYIVRDEAGNNAYANYSIIVE